MLDARGPLTSSEFRHDSVSLLLDHLSMHAADRKIGFPHLLSQPVYFSPGIAEDNRLRDGKTDVSEGITLSTNVS